MNVAAISAIEVYLPENELSNETLAAAFDGWDAAEILEKTGIANRRVADADQTSSDLAVAAASRLFDLQKCRREDVDFLLVCTQSPDYFLPSTACSVQSRLGLRTSCGAIDFNQGCSGFVYGLALAKGLIETEAARNVLLITAETYSKFINPRDRSVRTLFGDGAAATLVTRFESDREIIGPFVFGTDGNGAPNLIVTAGGFRKPKSAATAVEHEDRSGNWRSEENLFMNGPEIFNFTLKAVPRAVADLLARAQLTGDDIDYFVFHQANRFMLERLRAKLEIPVYKFCIEMEDCGNTVSSTIPIGLARSISRGRLGAGDLVMLVGFGVGYSWAATLIRIP